MIRPILLATTVALHALPSAAQNVADPLRAMLSRVPLELTGTPQTPAFIMFGDPVAGVVAMSAPPPDTADYGLGPYGATFRAMTSAFRDMSLDQLTGLPDRVGFGVDDVQAMLTIDNPPQGVIILQLDPAAAANVPAALLGHFYAETSEAGFPAFTRGGDDYNIDFTARDPADPFGGTLGRASRITLEDNVLMQAAGWPEIAALHDDEAQMLGARPDMAAILDALDVAAPDGAVLVRAMPLMNQPMFDRMPMRDQPPSEPVPGLPNWSVGLMADLSTGRSETAIIALSYATEAMAEDAATRLYAGWEEGVTQRSGETYSATAGGVAKVRVEGDGPYVTMLLVNAPTEVMIGLPANRPYEIMAQAMIMGDLAIIGPMTP